MIAGIDLSHQEDDVADILIDLAARDTMNQSRFLARTVINTLDDKNVKILDKKYRSAGFAVLKAPDMPSALIEMGYLSNRSEARLLAQSEHQRKLVAGIERAIQKYFLRHSSTFEAQLILAKPE